MFRLMTLLILALTVHDEITAQAVDGGWSTWSAYGPCSATCDSGTMTRTRVCNNPSPSNGGQACIGSTQDISAPCYDLPCPKWCIVSNGGCAQVCNPQDGACSCFSGYTLSNDQHSCDSPGDTTKVKCFPASSTVYKESGDVIRMSDVTIGDRVLAADSDGMFLYDDVIGFLHYNPAQFATFLMFTTEGGQTVSLTAEHLIYASSSQSDFSTQKAVFARDVKAGDFLFVLPDNEANLAGLHGVARRVLNVSHVETEGVFAPLTTTGNLVVDGVIVSCYALVSSHVTAHTAVTPLRLAYYMTGRHQAGDMSGYDNTGVHWFANVLLRVANYVLPAHMWY